MQDSIDNHLVVKPESGLTTKTDVQLQNIEVPNIEPIDYSKEVKKIVDVDEKHWNLHMLRVCTKTLTDLPKKDFKKKRWFAAISKNYKLETKILEQMLCDKADKLTSEEFPTFYKRLRDFESKKHLHPRKKYVDY